MLRLGVYFTGKRIDECVAQRVSSPQTHSSQVIFGSPEPQNLTEQLAGVVKGYCGSLPPHICARQPQGFCVTHATKTSTIARLPYSLLGCPLSSQKYFFQAARSLAAASGLLATSADDDPADNARGAVREAAGADAVNGVCDRR